MEDNLNSKASTENRLNSQERIVAVIKLLAQNHYTGMRIKDIARELKTTESNTCRDIAILVAFDFVEKNTEGCLRLSVNFGAISHSIAKSYKKARLELSEDEQRYTGAFN